MSKSRNEAVLNAENLKQELWETMRGLRTGRVKPDVANATAAQSREIMRIVRTEIVVASMSGGKPSGNLLTFVQKT